MPSEQGACEPSKKETGSTIRITLVQPPSVYLLSDKAFPPLGILHLASWLQKHGHEVSVVDLAGHESYAHELIREEAKIASADWIGITCTTPQYGDAKMIYKTIRHRGHKQPIIVGGIHLTSLTYANEMDFIHRDGFDSYVVGEGYNAVTRICQDISQSGKPQKLYAEPVLKDVNMLPFAARELVDLDSYKYFLGKISATSMYTQYGCYYECSYCESKMAGSGIVRMMSPQRIQDEVRHIRDTYGIHGIMFYDDELNLDKKRILGICEKFEELQDVRWRGFVVASKFDSEIARACKKSGCFEIASGVESGSPKILANIRKPATQEINKRFVKTAKEAGLRVKTFMIVGLPGESWETIRETDKFLEDLKREGCAPDDVDFSILQVYKGSNIYRDRDLLDVHFDPDSCDGDKSYYKTVPGVYEDMIQVSTSKMSKYELIAARNYLEDKWKPKGWQKDNTARKDLDRVSESIAFAEQKIH